MLTNSLFPRARPGSMGDASNTNLRGYSSDGRRDLKNVVISPSILRHHRKLPAKEASTKRRRMQYAFVFVFLFCLCWFFISTSPTNVSHNRALEPLFSLDSLPSRIIGGRNGDINNNNNRGSTSFTASKPAAPPTPELERLDVKGADRVKVLAIPRSWNRYDLPWFVPQVNYPRSFEEARYRITYAPTKMAMSDGLGHCMTAINYELLVALRFGLAYSHRRSTYSSLTAVSRDAVEDFFGWGDGYISREDVRAACEPAGGEWKTEGRNCMACARLREDIPPAIKDKPIKRIVTIPYKLAHKCPSNFNGRQHCDVAVNNFLAANNESNTVFQLPTNVCEHPTSDSDMNDSKGLFFAHYWRRHSRRGSLFTRIPLPLTPSNRMLRLQENRLNIAVHIRRGDFLRSDVKAKRGIMKDEIYAAVIADVIAIISKVDSPFQKAPVTIHIYSEGRIEEKTPYSSHATDIQNKQYFDATGAPRGSEWWTQLLRGMSWRAMEVGGSEARIRDAKVQFHISDDTLTSLHEMAAADVFVGSRSGLSTQLVWSLSRGITIIPMSSSIALELGKVGQVCCSVPFDHDTATFNHERFERYWEAYGRANGPSAKRAFSGIRRRRRRRR